MMSRRALRLPLRGPAMFNIDQGRADYRQIEEALCQVCTEKDLIEIACKLDNWEILCAHLSISNAEQAELKKNHQGDYRLQKMQALKSWKHKFGQNATYDCLENIVERLGNISLAEDITHLALESYKAPSAHGAAGYDLPWHAKPDINDLMNFVPLIAPKWSLLGIKLNIPENMLTSISRSGTDLQCTASMLRLWLNPSGHASWNELLRALELPIVGLADVAEKLKAYLSTVGGTGTTDSVASTSPVKLTNSGRKYTCLMIDLIEMLPSDSWKKMRMALEHYIDPNSGLYPGEVDPAVYKDVISVSDMLSSLKKYQMLTPVELGWLKFLVDDIVKCKEASQRIKEYEASIDTNLLLGNVHFASSPLPTEGTALLCCRSDIQPETATYGNLRLAKAGCTSYVGIQEHEAVLQSVSVGSIIFYWRIPYLKAIEVKLSKSVSSEMKRTLDKVKITYISVMVGDRHDRMYVDDMTVHVDHEVDQKAFLNSPVAKPKRRLSDSRKYWFALRRKDTSLSYQVEFYSSRQLASRRKDVLQVLSFSDITEVRLSRNQKHTLDILCSSVGYSVGLNCDSEAEKLLKDLQHLLSSHRQLYHYAMSKSHRSSVGKLLQVDGRCVSPDSIADLKFYDSVFGHLRDKPPELLNCVIKCSFSQMPTAKISADCSPVAHKRSSKTTPLHPFAMRSLDLSFDSTSKISEPSEGQRRRETFSSGAHNISMHTHASLHVK